MYILWNYHHNHHNEHIFCSQKSPPGLLWSLPLANSFPPPPVLRHLLMFLSLYSFILFRILFSSSVSFFSMVSLIEHSYSETSSFCFVHQSFIWLHCWVVFQCMDSNLFIHSHMVGHLCCLQFWMMITNKASWTPVYSVYVCECMLSHVLLFFNPMDCSPPGSSVHGILQARILEWVASPFSRGSSQPRDQIWVSCIAGRFFIIWDYVYGTNLFVSIWPDFLGNACLIWQAYIKFVLKIATFS